MSSNDDDDDFKSAIPDNKIPDRGSLYIKAMDIFDNQYAIHDRNVVPENKWIFENNLEFFKLRVEDVDRLYSFDNKDTIIKDYKKRRRRKNLHDNVFIIETTILCVRIKPQQQQREEGGGGDKIPPPPSSLPLYVIFSQFNEKDKGPMYGWILLILISSSSNTFL